MKRTRQISILILGLFAVLALAYTLNVSPNLASANDKIWTDSDSDHEPFVNPEFNNKMNALVTQTLPAVVSIATEKGIGRRGRGNQRYDDFFDFFFNMPQGRSPFKQQGLGSGFIINENGYILTNNHVIEDADEITVTLDDGKEYPAKIIGRDERTDLGLVKIEAGDPLPYLVLGDSDRLEVGHMVVAMGNPLGLSQTVTQGIVSQKGRKDITPSGRHIYANFIQTDASINPGNSGGPLLNIYGEVVGINTAIAQGAGIGFAIPVNMAKTLLPQLVTGKVERSWIGIRIQQINSELAESLGLKEAKGALVAATVPDSPADKAGLKAEDVILKFDGKDIKTYSDLTWYASTAGVGTKVKLEVWRDKKTISLSLTLGRMPDSDEEAMGDLQPGDSGYNALGMHVTSPDPKIQKRLGISDGKGALITRIEMDSPAASAGLRPGDVVRKVNSVIVKSPEHFVKIMKKIKKGKTVRMLVNRNRMALFIAFRNK